MHAHSRQKMYQNKIKWRIPLFNIQVIRFVFSSPSVVKYRAYDKKRKDLPLPQRIFCYKRFPIIAIPHHYCTHISSFLLSLLNKKLENIIKCIQRKICVKSLSTMLLEIIDIRNHELSQRQIFSSFTKSQPT